jgi:hypothetical protein
MHRRIYFDQHPQGNTLSLRHFRQVTQVLRVVNADLHISALCQRTEPHDLVTRHHLIGNQDIREPSLDHDLSLGDLGSTHPTHGTPGAYLHVRQEGTFEILDMGAHFAHRVSIRVSNETKVVLNSIEVNE